MAMKRGFYTVDGEIIGESASAGTINFAMYGLGSVTGTLRGRAASEHQRVQAVQGAPRIAELGHRVETAVGGLAGDDDQGRRDSLMTQGQVTLTVLGQVRCDEGGRPARAIQVRFKSTAAW